MKTIRLCKVSSEDCVVNVKFCDTFLSKFIGLMFSGALAGDGGVILVDERESRMNASIHMLFMRYDLTVLWLDKRMVVVDKVLAKRWFPIYIPKQPAQYIVELHHSRFSDYSVGDQLMIVNDDSDLL